MALPTFRKTLIALAVLTSQPVLADTLNLTGSPTQVVGPYPSDEPLILTGQASGTEYAVDLEAPYSFGFYSDLGGVTNRADLTATGENADALRFSNSNLFTTLIQGDVVNEGSLTASGLRSSGLHFYPGVEFFKIDIMNSPSLVNSASIISYGEESSGIYLQGASNNGFGYPSYAGVIGNLINTGLIQANGSNAAAIRVGENGLITGALNSNGGFTGGLVNSGVIEARGANAAGVLLDAKAFVMAVHNSGTISADGVAIDARANDLLENIIQTSGLIEGGSAAIRANGNTDVLLSGGEIQGDLLGLDQLNATGGLIDSAHIEAKRFAVGQVELAQAHSQLTGNLELLGSSALDLNLSRQTDRQRAILAVSGTGTFAADDQIRLKATAQDFRLAGPRQYVLISANQVIDQGAASEHGLSVTSLSDLLRVYSYQVSDTQITAMVGGISTQEAVDYLRAQGASNHVLPAYGMFYGNVVSQLDDSDPLVQAFTSSNDQQLLALANQLAPDVSGALNQNQSSNLNLLGGTLQQRGNTQRQGLSAGDGLSETGAWLQVLNSDANQGSRSGTPGYDADSQGILVGADGKLNESTTLGLAYSFIDSDVHSAGNKTESDAQALSLYGNWSENAWFADASLTYGQADNDSRRTISSTRAKANFDSQLLGAELLGGYSFAPQPGLQLEPRVGTRYNRIDIDGYHEKGSSAALAVSAQRYEVGELGAGLRLASELNVGAGRLKPELTLMAWHDLIADQVNSNSAFLAGGSAFVTSGSAPTRDSYQANIGVDYELGAVTLGLGYDYLGKADYSADTFNAKVRYDF